MSVPQDTYKDKKEAQDRRTTRKATKARKTNHSLEHFRPTDQAEIKGQEIADQWAQIQRIAGYIDQITAGYWKEEA